MTRSTLIAIVITCVVGAIMFAMTESPRTGWASVAFMSASLFTAFVAGQNWGILMTSPCLECGSTDAQEVGGETIYPHRPDLFGKRFWLCSCGAYVGCHPNSSVPLGAPAGEQTRRARVAAHAVFDPLWKSGKRSRREAYCWLAERMGIAAGECHIGRMTLAQARRAAEICMEERALP